MHGSRTMVFPDRGTAEGALAEVLRRQDDGSWKLVIDSSDGPALADHADTSPVMKEAVRKLQGGG